ncbi:MAG: XRE family transcriptional regulator [Betaproteobacteria bacterium]|nr:MAG: XRE family transcriptional regulator [Betaproteobacteria bacterium]
MPPNGLGAALSKLRDRRTLSIRELSTLADLDHAYVYRLETGEKTNPSVEAMEKLIRGLKPSDRDAKILKWLAQHPEANAKLVLHVLEDGTVTFEEFTVAAATAHRGNVRPDPAKLIDRVRKIMSEED